MDSNQKALILLAILISAALILSFVGISYPKAPPPPFSQRPTFVPHSGDIELYYTINVVVTTVNAALLIFLFSTYLGMYRKVKSDFTLGLMVFSITLLLYAISSNPLAQWPFGFRGFGLGPFTLLPNLFTCAALAVLVYLTFRY